MFVLTNNVSAAQKAIATLLATALVMWSIGYFAIAEAANVTSFSDLITDSAPGAAADHTITFTTPTGISAGETITVTFEAGFDFTNGPVAFGDMDLSIAAADQTLAAAPAGATWGAVVAGQVVTFTSGSGTASPGDIIEIQIGTNAASGVNQIVNPSSPTGGNQSYEIDIAGTMTDIGHTRIVILDTVLVTAQVNTTFDFTVYDNGTGEDVNGETTTITTSSTTIPFGTLSALSPEIGSQDLTVSTNAINGFVVTVETDQSLLSSTGADIDNFKDDVIAAPAAWESPSVGISILDEKTWGHWGLTSEDSDLNGDEFGANLWAGVTSTPRQVFSHNGPADGVTVDKGSTTVGYQVEISALQEAGDDYSTTLTYIATPTF